MNQWDKTSNRSSAGKLHNATLIPNDGLSAYYVLNAPYHYKKIKEILDYNEIDVVVTANILAGILATVVAKRKRIPTICDYLDHYPDSAALYYTNSFMKRAIKIAVKKLVTLTVKSSKKVVVVSKTFENLVKREYEIKNEKIAFIPNGVNIKKFRPRNRDEALKKLGLEHLRDYLLLVYVGSIEPRFDFETILTAVDKFGQEGYKVKWLVIGPSLSNYSKKLRERLSKSSNVEFVGYVADYILPYYINAANICLAPYKMMEMNYGITLKVLQYLASAKITFATPIPDIQKVFGHSVIIYYDANDLVKKIRKVKARYNEYLLLAQRGYKIAIQFSWNNISETYENLMQSLILGD